jgi:hypothetical protein
MDTTTREWIDDDEHDDEIVAPPRPRRSNRTLAEDLDPEEQDEWGRERGSRGRKPARKKHRRPKPEFDDEP